MGDINERRKEGSLYTAAVKGNVVGDPQLVDEDVYAYYGYYLPNGDTIYFKDVSDRTNEGDLFVGGKEVDYDVYIYSLDYSEEMGALLYTTDTKNGEGGTMKRLKGNKPEVIGEDLYTYRITDSGKLYYLSDYSERKCTGDLCMSGRKDPMVDEDIVALLWPAHKAGDTCGSLHYWDVKIGGSSGSDSSSGFGDYSDYAEAPAASDW